MDALRPLAGCSAPLGRRRYELSIAMAGRLRDDQKHDVARTAIPHLVRDPRRDLQTHAGLQPMPGTLDLQLELAREDVEELPGPEMAMSHLCRTGRHALLNDAEIRRAHQVPAVAPGAPLVVFGRGGRNRNGQCLGPPES